VFTSWRLFRRSSKSVSGEEVLVVPSPSSVKRVDEIGTKSGQIDDLITEIVPLIEELDEKGLREVKSFLDSKVIAARHALAKESTKVYVKGTLLRPS
jgi:hypothetical protein